MALHPLGFAVTSGPGLRSWALSAIVAGALLASTRNAHADSFERGPHLAVGVSFIGLHEPQDALSSRPFFETGFALGIRYVGPLGKGWALGGGVRLGKLADRNNLIGGFDVPLYYRFDRFTGEAWAPYVLLGPTILFGPSSSNDDLLPIPDLGIEGGVGVDLRLNPWLCFGPTLSFSQPVLARKSYSGPFDVFFAFSFDL